MFEVRLSLRKNGISDVDRVFEIFELEFIEYV